MSLFAMQVSKTGRASVEVNVPQPQSLRDPTWKKLVHEASDALLNNLAFGAWRVWFQGRVRKLLPAAGAGPERLARAKANIEGLVGKLTYGGDARVATKQVTVLDLAAEGVPEYDAAQLDYLESLGIVVLGKDSDDEADDDESEA